MEHNERCRVEMGRLSGDGGGTHLVPEAGVTQRAGVGQGARVNPPVDHVRNTLTKRLSCGYPTVRHSSDGGTGL